MNGMESILNFSEKFIKHKTKLIINFFGKYN